MPEHKDKMRAKSQKDKEDTFMNWGKVGLFAGGVLFGTAGIKILTSRDAKEAVMTTATNIREGADDILADAKALNEKYAAEDAPETIEDAAE